MKVIGGEVVVPVIETVCMKDGLTSAGLWSFLWSFGFSPAVTMRSVHGARNE